MRKTTLFLLITIVIASIILLLTGERQEKPLPLLRLAHAPHDHHAPLYVAALNPQYFKKNGGIYLKEITAREKYDLVVNDKSVAHVTIHSSTGGREIIRKLSEGQYDMSFGGVPAILHFIDRDADIKIIAPVMTEGAGLVVRKDMAAANWAEFVALARQSVPPLKIGYKIAVSVHNLIFEFGLARENLAVAKDYLTNDGDINVVNLYGAQNLIPALQYGMIDGFVVNQPYLAMAEAAGIGKTIALFRDLPPHGKWQGHPCCALAASQDYIDNYPKVAEAATTLLMRANRYITDNKQTTAPQIATWLNISPEVETRSIATIHYTTELDANWNRGVDFWVNSMLAGGKLQKRIKLASQQDTLWETIYSKEVYEKARANNP